MRSKLHYELLIYGSTSESLLSRILILQTKIIRLIYFIKNEKSVQQLMESIGILTEHALYAYELLTFVLRSTSGLHSGDYLNNMHQFRSKTRTTRSTHKCLLIIPPTNNKIIPPTTINSLWQRQSLSYRGAKLLNLLVDNDIFSQQISLNDQNYQFFAHILRYNYISGNRELVNFIFE